MNTSQLKYVIIRLLRFEAYAAASSGAVKRGDKELCRYYVVPGFSPGF